MIFLDHRGQMYLEKEQYFGWENKKYKIKKKKQKEVKSDLRIILNHFLCQKRNKLI